MGRTPPELGTKNVSMVGFGTEDLDAIYLPFSVSLSTGAS
jgi:hypothetical protein